MLWDFKAWSDRVIHRRWIVLRSLHLDTNVVPPFTRWDAPACY